MFEHLYAFTPQLILRTPARPFTLAIDEASIAAALADAAFSEALYLASPALHEECARWQRGELTDARKLARLQSTLVRYYTRSSTRSTPFGLFAGCAVVAWGPASAIRLVPGRHRRHTRLDMHYLCALGQQLAEHPSLQLHLRCYPNTSLHQRGPELRYVEQQYSPTGAVQQLSALDASALLQQVVAAAAPGPTGHELAASLLAEEAERPEAEAFVQELLRSQVLVSELAPTVTGAEYLAHLQAGLARVLAQAPTPAAQALAQQLADVQTQLHALDQRGTNTAADYARIEACLAPLGVPSEPGKLFQTDATYGVGGEGTAPATLSTALQATLCEALEVLACLAPPPQHPRLADFTRRFEARYEEREVALLEALDAESGLAYAPAGSSRYSALVHDLVLPTASGAGHLPHQRASEQLLGRLLREAERHGRYAIDLPLAELRAQGIVPAPQPLAPSIGVLFRPVGGGQVVVESADGSSAVNLLGRFAHAAPGVAALIQEVTQAEQAHNPQVAFAEICHLPASRIGNLLQRPHFRELEIPYLAQSTLPADRQVAVQDLTLAAHHGQLVLRSRTSRQLIVPRLSTAHNFDAPGALPVYQFLCDLQTQGLQASLGFSWQGVAAAAEAKFLPRLTSGAAVLAVASWQLTAADLHPLLAAAPGELAAQVAAFRAQWQLPRLFTLADADNELFVDAENPLLLRVWLEAVRPRATVLLKEFLFDPAASPVRDAAGQPYVAQCLALLVRQAPCYAALPAPPAPAEADEVEQDFALGSEWLYYKLYCGQLVADRLLLEAIGPLAATLRERGLIDNWFFVRYADPDNHLRVRWHLPDPSRVGEVVALVAEYLRPFSADHAIWRVQTDTYRRELARYGRRTIAASEALFGYQSDALLGHLAQLAAAEEPAEPWLWGLAAIDELLTAFGYELAQKAALLHELKAGFAQEFGLRKDLKMQLDAKYRAARAAIAAALAEAPAPPVALRAIAQLIEQRAAQGPPEVVPAERLGSYIHLLLNRVLPADARLHELVLYDFLARHYASALARQRG
jgi:thiopeptide-type bacteriocin biosynthesis protein